MSPVFGNAPNRLVLFGMSRQSLSRGATLNTRGPDRVGRQCVWVARALIWFCCDLKTIELATSVRGAKFSFAVILRPAQKGVDRDDRNEAPGADFQGRQLAVCNQPIERRAGKPACPCRLANGEGAGLKRFIIHGH
jgi:hypothetical protein